MTTTIELKSDFALPDEARECIEEVGNTTITAISDDLGKASKLCTDVKLAFEYGAFPAAHAVLLEGINEANREGQPLACSMAFTL
ncbi:MAG TPA: hypothetical protein VFS88_07090 [Micavibrio sp.]|nr:hypothetical protein [Micavibrio sp.]